MNSRILPTSKATIQAFAVIALIAGSASPALSQLSATQKSAMKANCRNDFMSHCASVTPGTKDALECLQRNVAGLSAACKKVVSSTMGAPVAPAAATMAPAAAAPAPQEPKAPLVMTAVIGRSCLRDLIKHCRDVGLGGGKKLACLVAHKDELTFMCRTAMKMT